MRYNDLRNSFTDLDPRSYLLPPHIIVPKTDYDVHRIDLTADRYQSEPRKVLYETVAGVVYYLELVPYIHPAGAAALVLGTIVTNADGSRTFTITSEGRIITETGVLVPAGAVPQRSDSIAGMLFGDYYYHFEDNASKFEQWRATQINPNDFLWLVRRGDVFLDASAGVTSGRKLVSSTGVAGEVREAVALDTTSAVTLSATLQEHLLDPEYYALAVAKATIAGAGLVQAWLNLPPRYGNP